MFKLAHASILTLGGVMSLNACADIVISGTRIIYPSKSKDVTVILENKGNKPLLVQPWLDDGRGRQGGGFQRDCDLPDGLRIEIVQQNERRIFLLLVP